MTKSQNLTTAAGRGPDSGSDASSLAKATAGAKEELNELDLAIQVQQAHQLVYRRTLKHFERYNTVSGVWEVLTDHQMKAHVVEYITSLSLEQQNLIPALTVTRLVNAVCTLLKYRVPEPAPTPTDLKDLVCMANGVLDLSQGSVGLLQHNPVYHMTSASPVAYDPHSTCAVFSSLLLGTGFTSDDASLMQRYFGGVLLGANESQRILVIKGNAGIGKSTIVTILENVIGLNYVAYLRTQHLGGRFEMGSYVGKKLLVGKDVSQDFLSVKWARIVKSLVGGDFLQAERKGNNNRIDLHGHFHMVITCNSDIKIPAEQDRDAWQRRLLVVNSHRKKPDQIIPDLAGRILREEASGVLNWLIQGAIVHRTELARFGTYQLTSDQQHEIDIMLDANSESAAASRPRMRGRRERENPRDRRQR